MGKHKAIYNSSRWQRVRALKLRESPLCEYCPAGQQKTATEVDHYKSLEDGGAAYDMANLRSACKPCHSGKTAHGEKLYGCDINGIPRGQDSLWCKA